MKTITQTQLEEAITKAYRDGNNDLREQTTRIIKDMKLPDPNPYGQWVSIKNVNKIIDMILKLVKPTS